jgi:hypothetical protein
VAHNEWLARCVESTHRRISFTEVPLVNAQHIKAVPGRKTDQKDSEWIAQLLTTRTVEGELYPRPPTDAGVARPDAISREPGASSLLRWRQTAWALSGRQMIQR